MMNNANEISKKTKLYGFIGEHAGVSSMSATLNREFKLKSLDAMMIPLNIREDDFYYTLVNMKKSHVNGALISNEYTKAAFELLDDSSEAVKLSKMCDFVIRDENRLVGYQVTPNALVAFLQKHAVKRVALLGVNEMAGAFCCTKHEFEVGYFYDDLEQLVSFCDSFEIKNPDINRIADGMHIDLDMYDAIIDFSEFKELGMVEKLPKLCVDMKQKKASSPLMIRAKELGCGDYVGFENIQEEISKEIVKFLDLRTQV